MLGFNYESRLKSIKNRTYHQKTQNSVQILSPEFQSFQIIVGFFNTYLFIGVSVFVWLVFTMISSSSSYV